MTEPRQAPAGRPVAPVAVAVVVAVALATLTGVLLATTTVSVASLYGLGTPSSVVEAVLPATRLLATLGAAGAVAALLVAAVFAPGGRDGLVSPRGYLALRTVPWLSAVQVLAYLVIAWLTLVENTGLAAGQLLGNTDALLNGAQQVEPVTGWVIGALVAALVGVVAFWTLTWRASVGLLLAELCVQLPITLTAATNAQRSHDIAGDALTLHVLAALLWLGSTVAVVASHRGGTAVDRPTWRRHAVVTAWAMPVVAVSGVVSAAYAISAADLFTSGYGWLTVGSAVLVAALVPLGRRARAFALRADSAAVWRLPLVELALLGLASALGTGLARVVPPAQVGYETSRLVYLIGYELPAHLTAGDLVLHWRPDLVFGPLAVIGAVLYLLGVRRVRAAGGQWPVGETVAWLAGCAVLLVSTSSGLGAYAPALFSVHMVQHMLLATTVPTLLVLGHGISLLLRVLPAGAAWRVTDLLHAPLVRLVRNPLAAWVAVGVTLFGLYPTGFYAAILEEHWAHLGMNVAFLGTGLALFWSVLGRSPGRAALPPIGQIVMVFALMGLHAAFSAWLLGQPSSVAGDFYTALRLPYVPDVLADQHLGAVLGWALAEVPVILAVVALVLRWTRQDRTAAGDRSVAWRPVPAGAPGERGGPGQSVGSQ